MPSNTQRPDIVKKAEEGLRKVEAMIDRERKALNEAKHKLERAQAKAKASTRAAEQNAVKRAKAAVDKVNQRLKTLRGQLDEGRASLADSRVLTKIKASEVAVRQKLEERASALASRAEADLAKAVKVFEQRFMKKRALEDKNKLASIEKKLQAKHRQAVKQLASKLNDPEVLQASTARTSRTEKAVARKKAAAPKKKLAGKKVVAKKVVVSKQVVKKKAAKKPGVKKAAAKRASARKAVAKAKVTAE